MHPELLTTVKSYSRKLFMADLFAGATVAMAAVDLALRLRRRNVPPAEWDTPDR